tara:strand:+ start:4482 stop:5285 length:804 start_codon:yes stop_codon:yes gene_type:complete
MIIKLLKRFSATELAGLTCKLNRTDNMGEHEITVSTARDKVVLVISEGGNYVVSLKNGEVFEKISWDPIGRCVDELLKAVLTVFFKHTCKGKNRFETLFIKNLSYVLRPQHNRCPDYLVLSKDAKVRWLNSVGASEPEPSDMALDRLRLKYTLEHSIHQRADIGRIVKYLTLDKTRPHREDPDIIYKAFLAILTADNQKYCFMSEPFVVYFENDGEVAVILEKDLYGFAHVVPESQVTNGECFKIQRVNETYSDTIDINSVKFYGLS